ncbi:MAG: tetratricopeptide repeat protein [Pyrinomonadaceae bacterium]|nr:tetratricopeptide repeat protein [Pyrinomonadaceae bacterium]
MRSALIGIFIAIFCFSTSGQRPVAKPTPKKSAVVKAKATPVPTPEPTPTPDPAELEREQFDSAHAATALNERVAKLEAFVSTYPSSERVAEASESLMIARAALAEELLDSGNVTVALALMRKTITESPVNTPDGLANEVIMKIPGNLYFRGNRAEAFEAASLIESRFAEDPARLAALANFHIAIENGSDAVRLANRAIEMDPALSAAYQILGLAHRLNFDLDAAAVAFLKAVETDPSSVSAKRGLADINRAVGRSAQAADLYRQILAANENDAAARTGLVLSLFESGKRDEGETELSAALQKNANNLPLLAGAAYWYAANKDGAKAIEYANKALAIEPRYVWSHIALARGQIADGKPVDAEKTLIAARKYGNFPTLDYEIAIARMHAGFFKEAAEALRDRFTFENGEARTRLGGRVETSNSNLAELIAGERQSSILAPRGPDDSETARQIADLKALLTSLEADEASPETIAAAAERFAAGSDPMSIHRSLFAASLLLEKKVAVEKAAQLTASLAGRTDAGLNVPNASAAVMADELYPARSLAASRGEFLIVPEVPRQTLGSILRGRVEDLAGKALMEQGKSDEAAVRFKRAISVLPEKSAWWRTTKWGLGNALAAQGNEKEALEHYLASYDRDQPDLVKYIVVEALYRKVNDGLDGLEARIGPSPLPQRPANAETPASDAATPAEQTPVVEKAAATEQKTTAEPVVEPPKPTEPEPTPVPEPVKTEAEPAKVQVEPSKAEVEKAVVEERPLEKEKPATAEKLPDLPKPAATPITTETVNAKVEDPKPAETVIARSEDPKPAEPEKPKEEAVVQKAADTPVQPSEIAEVKPALEKTPEPEATPTPTPERVVSIEPASSEKPLEAAKDPAGEKPAESVAKAESTGQKSLFEPIIITIPSNKPITPKTANASSESPSDADKDKSKREEAAVRPCKIDASQENVSLINGGGSIGLLISMENGEIDGLRAASNSPEDVEVIKEPAIAGLSGRAFYIIRSKSERAGMYQISFSAPCGKKDVTVQVR